MTNVPAVRGPIVAFAPLYTATTWDTIVAQTAKAAHDRNGDLPTTISNVTVPALTNRDAIALIAGWRRAAAPVSGAFSLWYAYAAPAYGWEKSGDAIVVDDDQAARAYDDAPNLWRQMMTTAKELDRAQASKPTLAPMDVWADPAMLGEIAKALQDDGADAQVKVPTGFCVDAKTGKKRPINPKRQPDGSWSDPDCKPITVDDPITAVWKGIKKLLGRAATPLAAVGVAYVAITVLGKRRAKRGRRRLLGAARRRQGRKRLNGYARS